MLLEELIPGLNLEDYSNEFKGTIEEGELKNGERKEIGWLKELCAFANTEGGTLYIGVHNKTHEILALDHAAVDSITRMIHRLVKEHIEPPLYYRVEPIAVPGTSPIRYVLAIRVAKSEFPPLSLRFKGIGAIFVRHFGETCIATNEELRYMILNSDQAAYDTIVTNQVFNWADFSTLRNFYKERNGGRELSEKELLNIGFMTPDGFLKKGSLLFKDECKGDETLIECSQFASADKGSNEFKVSKSIKKNLLASFIEAVQFVESHSSNGFVKTAKGREELISFPPRSLAEGIANAIGHRNYFLQGTQIEINLYPDRLEIISPGSLLGTRWLSQERNLSRIPPMRRNKLICDALSLCRIMDHKGSGFDKIEEEYGPYGFPFAPFADSDGNTFSLTLPDLTYKRGLIQLDEEPAIHCIDLLPGKNDLMILSFCYSKPRTASQIAEKLGVRPSSYLRNQVLKPLVDKGYLILNQTAYPAQYQTSKTKTYL